MGNLNSLPSGSAVGTLSHWFFFHHFNVPQASNVSLHTEGCPSCSNWSSQSVYPCQSLNLVKNCCYLISRTSGSYLLVTFASGGDQCMALTITKWKTSCIVHDVRSQNCIVLSLIFLMMGEGPKLQKDKLGHHFAHLIQSLLHYPEIGKA